MHRLWLLLIALVYLAGALFQLELPGLHYDEAFEAVPAVQLLQGQAVTAFRQSTLTLFNKQFPLTTQDYIGALNTYGLLPFLAIGGINPLSLRLYAVLVGLVTLGLVYGFTRDLTASPIAGLAAAALLAVNATFLFWNRQGIFVTAITAAIGAGAAWSWLCWQRSGRYRFALLGAFLFGLGLYAKLLFVWLIAALLGTFLFVQIKSIRAGTFSWSAAVPLSARQVVGLLLAGLGGCWPLVLYNLQTNGTWKSISQNAETSFYGVNNADIFTNLSVRIDQLGTLITSGHLWYLGQVYENRVALIVFLLALGVGIWLAFQGRGMVHLLPFVVISLVVVASIVTVSALWLTHYALIMVWPTIAIVLVGAAVIRHFSGQHLVKMLVGLIFLLLLFSEANVTLNYHRVLATSGGLSDHSDAIYDLANWLKEHRQQPIVAMDWGLAAPITFLTAGQVNAVEIFGYQWMDADQFERVVSTYIGPKVAIFLWRAPDEVIFDRSDSFKALYQPLDLEENILEAFYEKSGRPVLGATQLVPAGTAENKPAVP